MCLYLACVTNLLTKPVTSVWPAVCCLQVQSEVSDTWAVMERATNARACRLVDSLNGALEGLGGRLEGVVNEGLQVWWIQQGGASSAQQARVFGGVLVVQSVWLHAGSSHRMHCFIAGGAGGPPGGSGQRGAAGERGVTI
jgi:hypothetical protein